MTLEDVMHTEPRTAEEMEQDEPELRLDDNRRDFESETQTVLACDLRVGDVLVFAALGGQWNAPIKRVRPMGLEVLIAFDSLDPVCLERNEVCEVRRPAHERIASGRA